MRVLLVVVTAGDYHQGLVIDAVNQPVGVVDAARPKAREVFLEGLGFANALEWVTQAVLDQDIDSLEGFAVLALPVCVIVPGGQGPRQFQQFVLNRQRPDPVALPVPGGTARWSVLGGRRSPAI